MKWVEGSTRHHRDLKTFTCADPNGTTFDRFRRQKVHSMPWALEVQRSLRRWNFARNRHKRLRLGYAEPEGALLGVTVISGPVASADASGRHLIYTVDFMAVAFENQGSRLGNEVLAEALDCVADDATGHVDGSAPSEVLVQAVVHQSNVPAQRLLEAFGFAFVEDIPATEKNAKGKTTSTQTYGLWVAQLTLL